MMRVLELMNCSFRRLNCPFILVWLSLGSLALTTEGGPPESSSPSTTSAVANKKLSSSTPAQKPARALEPRQLAESHPLRSKLPVVEFVNQQIRQKWEEQGIVPSPFADDAEWLRRIYLDLTGHIPSYETTTEFLKRKDPEKRAQMLEGLLDSSDFARHWSCLWTNLLIGRATPNRINREALQTFLRDSFAKNRPWNEIVRDLITAEGDQRTNGAANFLLAHLNDGAVPATAISARLFLGTQIQCTQCHNHPFNDWKQNQFWEFNSFFVQLRRVERRKPNATTGMQDFDYLELQRTDRGGAVHFEQRNGLVRVAYPKYAGIEISPDQGVPRTTELARLMTAPDSEPLSRAMVNRMWAHFLGYGIVRPVDDLGPHKPPSHPEILDHLTREFIAAKFNLKQLARWICESETYQLTSRMEKSNLKDNPADGTLAYFSHQAVKSLTVEQLFDSLMIAIHSERGSDPDWEAWDKSRRTWMTQFVQNLQTDENDESTTFNGTIPQALMLMNGTLIRDAVDPEKRGLMQEVVKSSQKDGAKIQRLYLSTLNRSASTREVNGARKILSGSGSESAALQDLLWALLNCNEFICNH